MAQYTVLSTKNIQTIMENYGLGLVRSFAVLSGGSENTNYKVVTDTGKFVLTVCEQKSFQEAIELTDLLEHLAAHDFSTSKIVRNKRGEAVLEWEGKPVIVKGFITGEIVEDLSNELLEQLGGELAKLHRIPSPNYLPKKLGYGVENFNQVKEYAAGTPYQEWLNKIGRYVEKYISPSLPKALIHSDLFYNNVIVDHAEPRLSVMDFEEAAYYYRGFDIGMVLVGVCAKKAQLDLEKASHFLKGYASEIRLSKSEKESLKAFTVYAAAAMSFWRHKNFNYTNPNPEMADHYLALKNLADQVMGLPDDCLGQTFT